MRQAILPLGLLSVAVLVACTAPARTGKDTYSDLCAGCHGASGKGDGPAASALDVAPTDLTMLAARNGGVFPKVEVMAKIDGYARGEPHFGAMPAFWPLLEGETVLVETGDGILTPTPAPLVALADYIGTLQE